METFANIFKTCKDDQDLEVIYGKFVDMLKEFEGSKYSKDILRIVEVMAHRSKVIKEYKRVLEDRTDLRYAIEESGALHFSCSCIVAYYLRLTFLR